MTTSIHDLPDVLLSNVFASIADTRTRNSLALVCRKFMSLERSTRLSLTLRGNVRDLFMIPTCFRSVSSLDLSLLSPWGHSLLSSSDPLLLAHRLRQAFPYVTCLTLYARSPSASQILVSQWPGLTRLKLVRWHQRLSHWHVGADFEPLFHHCPNLTCLDLSSFYYWTEDVAPVLHRFPMVSISLLHLNLLTTSFAEGFKSDEIRDITAACPQLKGFRVVCNFDPRYIGSVGDETLLAVATNCPKLTLLHMVDSCSLSGNPEREQGGFSSEDARITRVGLVDLFSALPFLEDLVLDVCTSNVRDSGFALELLNSKCKGLKALKLGQFHGVCTAIEWQQLDGVALCARLQHLSINNCADLSDMGLIAIGRGCSKLARFEIQGCKRVTEKGIKTLASLLRTTLVHVKISCCKNLGAAASLRALEPIRDRIQQLHIDCVWECGIFDLNGIANDSGCSSFSAAAASAAEYEDYEEEEDEDDIMRSNSSRRSRKKRRKISLDHEKDRSWDKLQCLSLWIQVGEVLTPLPRAGLEDCPNLEEICIKVEGDCRGRHKPSQRELGLNCLALYPRLSKMRLDCGQTIGYALTAPSGKMDLSLWERFFLNGIGNLSLNQLDYWPPQDRDVNQRSLSLPAAGLLAECITLRKLFIHGTAHEHFIMFFLRIPDLRDVQLREDYYPAPENDMSTEMRVDSCSRFEDKLNSRHILD